MSTIITKEMERNEAFREMMRLQKCPFRLKIETGASGTVYQHMMECDPDCAALTHSADKAFYSCLRLMNVNYEIPTNRDLTIFDSGIPKEEEENECE